MNSYRVGIAGFGAIGQSVAQSLNAGLPGLSLAAVAVRDPQAPPAFDWREPPRFSTLADLHAHCDVVVECAPAAVFRELAEPVLRAGKKLVVLSSGALLRHADLIELARQHGAQIIVPSGAILGLDAITAAAEGEIHSVTMITASPCAACWAPLSGGQQHRPDRHHRAAPGVPRLATRGRRRLPANLNVAVSVSLAGIGPTGPRWKSGPTRRWNATSTASRWTRTRPRSRWKSRTSPRPIPRLAASPRKASSPRCASLPGRCAWAPESGRRPARAAAARDTDWTPARQPRSRPARLHQRRK